MSYEITALKERYYDFDNEKEEYSNEIGRLQLNNRKQERGLIKLVIARDSLANEITSLNKKWIEQVNAINKEKIEKAETLADLEY